MQPARMAQIRRDRASEVVSVSPRRDCRHTGFWVSFRPFAPKRPFADEYHSFTERYNRWPELDLHQTVNFLWCPQFVSVRGVKRSLLWPEWLQSSLENPLLGVDRQRPILGHPIYSLFQIAAWPALFFPVPIAFLPHPSQLA